MDDARNTTNFTILLYKAYKDVSSITKGNYIFILGCWRPSIVFIATSIYKGYVVKFRVNYKLYP